MYISCRDLFLNLIEAEESIDGYDLDVEILPPLPIHSSKTKRYSQYVASRRDMLFLRRALLFQSHLSDMYLISNDEKYLGWYIMMTTMEDREEYIGIECSSHMAYWQLPLGIREREDIQWSYNILPEYVHAPTLETYPLNTIYSEISYVNQDVRIFDWGKFKAECYIVYAWGNKEDMKPIHQYGDEILTDLLDLSIFICESREDLHNRLLDIIGWDDDPLHRRGEYTMEESFDDLYERYDSGLSEYHMVKVGFFNGKYIKDVSHMYIPCDEVYVPTFSNKPIAYSDMIIMVRK